MASTPSSLAPSPHSWGLVRLEFLVQGSSPCSPGPLLLPLLGSSGSSLGSTASQGKLWDPSGDPLWALGGPVPAACMSLQRHSGARWPGSEGPWERRGLQLCDQNLFQILPGVPVLGEKTQGGASKVWFKDPLHQNHLGLGMGQPHETGHSLDLARLDLGKSPHPPAFTTPGLTSWELRASPGALGAPQRRHSQPSECPSQDCLSFPLF